jgi:hypothetical protein
LNETLSAGRESGVALRLPPQSKAILSLALARERGQNLLDAADHAFNLNAVGSLVNQ